MLPVLLRLNGQAVLHGSSVLYAFPELQRRASPWRRPTGPGGSDAEQPDTLTFGTIFRRFTGAQRKAAAATPQRYLERSGARSLPDDVVATPRLLTPPLMQHVTANCVTVRMLFRRAIAPLSALQSAAVRRLPHASLGS